MVRWYVEIFKLCRWYVTIKRLRTAGLYHRPISYKASYQYHTIAAVRLSQTHNFYLNNYSFQIYSNLIIVDCSLVWMSNVSAVWAMQCSYIFKTLQNRPLHICFISLQINDNSRHIQHKQSCKG